jgi:carbon monoxide dehydrogenase subunit G
MTVLERSIFIAAPAETIDAFTGDASRWAEWYPGVEQCEPDSAFPRQTGSGAKVVYKALGTHFNITFTSLEYNYLHSLAYRMDGMITGTMRYTLTAEDGGTRVTGTYDYEVPGGGLGKLFDKLVLERMNAENLEKALENMKERIEAGA